MSEPTSQNSPSQQTPTQQTPTQQTSENRPTVGSHAQKSRPSVSTNQPGPSVSTNQPTVGPREIERLAAAANLLVALDFDGTLAHFSDEPHGVRAVPGAFDAIHDLVRLPRTEVMVISGRTLELLAEATEQPVGGPVLLVGSHGAEPADGPAAELSPAQKSALQALADKAEAIVASAGTDSGMWVEYKPLAVGLHTRKVADKEAAGRANDELADFARELGERPDAQVTPKITAGKDILEVSVSQVSKGSYLQQFRARREGQLGGHSPASGSTPPPAHPGTSALSIVFAGDDTTDESVMEILDYRVDVGIRVGGGESAGSHSAAAPEDVVEFLRALATARAEQLS